MRDRQCPREDQIAGPGAKDRGAKNAAIAAGDNFDHTVGLAFGGTTTSSLQVANGTTTANGNFKQVTINSGARFLSADAGASGLTPGVVLTVINNTAATPIAGTFANLSDGSKLAIGSNSYQADYEGGDGNDLTLTVVP